MIYYNISYQKPHNHYVDFKLTTETNNADEMFFQLPSWRPGRYELANFSQNIQKWIAYDEKNKQIEFTKIKKDLWKVETKNIKKIKILYSFYCNKLDAGSSYIDEDQLYLNPVNCIFYIKDRINEEYEITFDLPKDYIIASSLESKNQKIFAPNFDLLAESPIICSNTLAYNNYKINNITFHLWFQGKCEINWKKIKSDFTAFTRKQIEKFGSFPVDNYHFLFQITPYRSYHGVEHTKNTVLLLGPGNEIMTKRYEDLLGLCSHELYHTWNIKAIRPIEMKPYDYTQENYFRTGYVAEGVTTYMGDLILFSSKVFNWKQFIKTQNQNLERHLMNYGRFNLSVAESGFDSWLDGYKLGAPNRKVSIYPDAALCMLMIDLEIIRNSNGSKSLHNVMKYLYEDFALKNIGYSEGDFINACVKYGGNNVKNIFTKHIYGQENYIPSLNKSIEVIGLNLKEKKNPNLSAQYFGFIALEENGKIIVKKVEPNSIADQKEIGPEDEIIEIDNRKVNKNISTHLQNKERIRLTFKTKFKEKKVILEKGNYFKLLEFVYDPKATKKQLELRKIWGK